MKKTKIIIAGDLMPMPCNYDLFAAGDAEALFGKKLCDLFASADYRVCNFEGCFTDGDHPIEKTGPVIKAPTSTIKAIQKLGINYATLGNTHSMDNGKQGYQDTCRTLEENGITWFGWGDNVNSVRTHVRLTDGDRRMILYNVTEQFENAPGKDSPGVNLYDEYRVCCEIKELKAECDFLVVLYHGGIEGTYYNSETMRRRFHRMADSGADVVISQHTHAIGEEEHYNGSYLLYGQGNFCFHFRSEVTPLLAEGLVLEIGLNDNGFTAKPHRIIRTEKGCVYDEKQELDSFHERSKTHDALLKGDKEAKKEFEQHFSEDCKNWLTEFLLTFRGLDPEIAKLRKELSPSELREHLLSLYPKPYLMALLTFLKNEEFNEIGRRLLSDLLKEKS